MERVTETKQKFLPAREKPAGTVTFTGL